MIKQIYILRHGETDWNVQNKIQGSEADIDMNDNGREQALTTGKYLARYQLDKNFDIVYTSPLKRTVETATIVADEINYTNKIIYCDELKEIRAGLLSGTTEHDRNSDSFVDYNNLILEYKDIIDPINKMKCMVVNQKKISEIYLKETFTDATERINKILQIIKESSDQKILLVTHTNFIKYLYMVLGNTEIYSDGDIRNSPNCKLGYVEYADNKFRIITHPNTVHLKNFD